MAKKDALNSTLYSLEDRSDSVEVFFQNETAWATQKAMSQIYDIDVSGITKHLKNVFDSKELDEKSNVQFLHIAKSAKPVKFYSLDAIISVGYRVNSHKATQFRIWANAIIKQYIRDGYVINEAVLRDDPSRLNALAAKIRELRANEKNVFAQVRECFKISASDYEPTSQEVRRFYSLLQDKFHHAITKMTASKLVMDRANSLDDNMGLITFNELLPTKQEARAGKNYLTKDELYRMYLLSEQFLLFAESSALMGKKLTMEDLHNQLDTLLEVNGYPVFDGYKDFLKDEAMNHAQSEYETFIELKKLEMHTGKPVDYLDYCLGLYKELQEDIDKISMNKLRQHFKEKNAKLEASKEKTNIEKLNENLVTALNYKLKNRA